MGGAGRKSARATMAVASNENPTAPLPAQRPVAARLSSRSARSNRLPGCTRRADEGIGDRPRRVGDDAERSSRQAEVAGVGADDPELTVAHGVREPLAQRAMRTRVELHGDDPRPGGQQRSR